MSSAFAQWVQDARDVPIQAYLDRRGLWSRQMIGDAGVPCPGCGGTDRFAVNTRKNLFICRAGGAAGDAIAAAEHIFGFDFKAAVADVAGRPAPGRDAAESVGERQAREAAAARRAAAEGQRQEAQAAERAHWRLFETQRAREIWDKAKPIAGTPGEAYLARRGLGAPPTARLRFAPAAGFYKVKNRRLHVGPALVAAIGDSGGNLVGVHRTWIDLDRPKGKAEIHDPDTGELLSPKKVRGTGKGGSILLHRPVGPVLRLVLGEGIETTLAVHGALPAWHADTEFRATVSLGNLAGKAAGKVQHPTETWLHARSSKPRPVMIENDVPHPDDDTPFVAVAATVREIVLLADGDSEPVRTRHAMVRAARRYQAAFPDVAVKIAWPAPGQDFNDMLRYL